MEPEETTGWQGLDTVLAGATMPDGAAAAFPPNIWGNWGKGQDLSGLQAGICLIQQSYHCDQSSQSEVSWTNEPLVSSGAETAISPKEQVDFHPFLGTKCSVPCFCYSSLFAITAVPFTPQLRQLPCHQGCKSNGPFCINRGSLVLQQPQHCNEDVLLPERKRLGSEKIKSNQMSSQTQKIINLCVAGFLPFTQIHLSPGSCYRMLCWGGGCTPQTHY